MTLRGHVNCFNCSLLTSELSSLLPFADGWSSRYTIPTVVLKKARVLLDPKLDAKVLERLSRLVLAYGGELVTSPDRANHIVAPPELVTAGGLPCVYSPTTFMVWFTKKSNSAGKQPAAAANH